MIEEVEKEQQESETIRSLIAGHDTSPDSRKQLDRKVWNI